MDRHAQPVQRRWGRPGGVAARPRAGARVIAVVAVALGSIGSWSDLAAAPNPPRVTATAASVSGEITGARRPSVSGDGRWVVFEGTVDQRSTVFRTDRSTGVTTELTPVPPGVRSGDTVHPVLSADGCVVVVQTQLALDLFRDDDVGERWDVYRQVLPECGATTSSWELVSTADGSGTARDDVDVTAPAAVNESGAVIAFVHPDADPGSPTGPGSGAAAIATISLADLTVPLGEPGRVVGVPALPAEAPTTAHRYDGLSAPALSGDGRHLAFVSDAVSDAAVPEWGTGPEPGGPATRQVYVWDRDDPVRVSQIRLVSGIDGVPAGSGAASPVVSRDGQVIAFESADTGLVDAVFPRCGDSCPTQIYRLDRDPDDTGVFDTPGSRELQLVSARLDASGTVVAGDQPSWAPALNVDGSQVAFVSRAALVPSPAGARHHRSESELDGDVLVAEIPLGELRRATDPVAADPVDAAHGHPALSSTGRVLVFDTAAPTSFGAPAVPDSQVVAVVTEPRISIAELDFGTVLTGWSSDELWLSVINEGPGAFAPGSVRSTSPNFTVLEGGSCMRGLVVPAGDSCTVYVSFTPTVPAQFTATLVVTESDPTIDAVPLPEVPLGDEPVDEPVDDPPADVPPVDGSVTDTAPVDEPAPVPDSPAARAPADPSSVETRLIGQGGEPALAIEPAALDLGLGVVGRPGERRAFDVRNVSFTPTSIESFTIGGAHPDDFRVTAESCTDRALNPGATCGVEVEFVPTSANRRTANLVATTATGQYAAGILGGVGRFEPQFEVAEPTVRAGAPLGIGLAGFPADTDVAITFADTGRTLAVVRTDASGGLLARVDVPRRERGGQRELVATAAPGVVATASAEVLRPSGAAPGLPGHGLG